MTTKPYDELTRSGKIGRDRRSKGLCVTCGLPAEPGLPRCVKCGIRQRHNSRRRLGVRMQQPGAPLKYDGEVAVYKRTRPMTIDEFKDRMTSAMMPVLKEAEQSGFLTGGTVTLNRHDGKGGFERILRITIAREGTECQLTEERVIDVPPHSRPESPRPTVVTTVHAPGNGRATQKCALCGQQFDANTPDCPACHRAFQELAGVPNVHPHHNVLPEIGPQYKIDNEVYTGQVCGCGSARVVSRGGCSMCLDCNNNVGGCG